MPNDVNAARVGLVMLMAACGQSPAATGVDGSSEAGGSTVVAVPDTTGAPTTSGSSGGSSTTSTASTASTGVADTTSTTSTASATTEGGDTSSGETSTGDTDAVCDPDQVLDAVSYNYIKTVDVGVTGVTAGYYNLAAGELVFLTGTGVGVRMALDGTVLGDVEAPMAVSDHLDGAAYDPISGTALLVDQDCNLAEVDAVTLAEIDVQAIDEVKFDVDFCSGIAVGTDGNLYIASLATDEVVVLSRDLKTEVDRFNVQMKGIVSIDGIAAIPGSDNLIVHSSAMPVAAIFTPTGEVVAPAADIGGGSAPLVGGVTPVGPDGLFTVCANGQVWLCADQQSSDCYKYAPEGAGDDVCGCLTGL